MKIEKENNKKNQKNIKSEKKKENDLKQKNEEENKPIPLKWVELDQYIGKPVWDTREEEWRILKGYKRTGNTYSITFTDIVDWNSYNDRLLYLEEVR